MRAAVDSSRIRSLEKPCAWLRSLLVLFVFYASALPAASLQLVSDLLPGTETVDGVVNEVVIHDSRLVFATDTTLWIADDTDTSATLVKDFENESGLNSQVAALTVVGSRVFFTVNFGQFGRELWVTDGTQAGTTLVADLEPGPEGSSPSQLVALSNQLLFTATTELHGQELWQSDGTPAGTTRLTDILPGPEWSNVWPLTVVDGVGYFSAQSPVSPGVGLWTTDGTLAGTRLVKHIGPGGIDHAMVSVNGVLVFGFTKPTTTDRESLWRSDGTQAGTVEFANTALNGFTGLGGLARNDAYVTRDDLILFAAYNDNGWGPWRSDATTAGTFEVQDIVDTSGFGDPRFMTRVGDRIYFRTSYPNKLWFTDGDMTTLTLVAELDVEEIIAVGESIYLRAKRPGDDELALFKSDGSAAGTVTVGSLVPEALLAVFGTELVYRARTTEGADALWLTDDVTGITRRLTFLNPTPASSRPTELTESGGSLFFTVFGELWKTDGSTVGTHIVKRFPHGTYARPQELIDINGELFFEADWVDAAEAGYGPVVSDGTEEGTVSVLGERGNPPVERYFTAIGDTLYFGHMFQTVTGFGQGHELVALNLLDKQVHWVKDIATSSIVPDASSRPAYLVENNGALLFAATDRTENLIAGRLVVEGSGRELWRSNGTQEGTERVLDINPNGHSDPQQLTTVADVTYFSADDSVHGRELWRTDGSAVGTRLVRDIHPAGAANPAGFVEYAGRIVFSADDGVHGEELWMSDGTPVGTVMIKDINPGSGRSRPADMIVFDGLLYFSAYDDAQGRELWVSDGTQTGTQRVLDIRTGEGSSAPAEFTVFNGSLYFAAFDGVNGIELWSTDGSASGTTIVQDLWQGPAGSAPSHITVYNNALYLAANDGVVGRELWRLASDTDGFPVVSARVTPATYAHAGERLYVNIDVSNTSDQLLTTIVITDNTGAQVCHIESLWFNVSTECTAVILTNDDDVVAGELARTYTVTSDQFSPQTLDLVVKRESSSLSYPRVLITADKVAEGNYGWVLYDDGTKHWVDGACRTALISSGLETDTLTWSQINTYADREPVACDSIVGLKIYPRIVITPDKIEPDNYGWVVFADGSKQWVDAACRTTLVSLGLPVDIRTWNDITKYPDGSVKTCDEIASGGLTIDQIVTTPDRLESPDYGWVVFSNNLKQWIDPTCRSTLTMQGVPLSAQPWTQISAIHDVATIVPCDELQRLPHKSP